MLFMRLTMGVYIFMRIKWWALLCVTLISVIISGIYGYEKKKQEDVPIDQFSALSYHSPYSSTFISEAQVYNLSVNSYQALFDECEEVLLVSPLLTNQNRGTFQTEVKVITAYKSKMGLDTEDELVIFEPMRLRTDKIETEFSYLPMVVENQYLVFLNHVDSFQDKKYFNFITPLFGLIPIKDSIKIIDLSYHEGETYKYESIKDYDLILWDLTDYLELVKSQLQEDPENKFIQVELESTLKYMKDQNELLNVIFDAYKNILNRDLIYQRYPN